MRLLSRGRSGPKRKGVILLVVLAMLTLFALVGVSFVLVADAQATSSRIAREAESAFRPEIDPEAAFSLFLSQLIYDVPDDAAGIFSAMRGVSLARNMYGWNPGALNDKPYNGTGRLHTAFPPNPATPTVPASRFQNGVASTDAALVNYRFFPTDTLPAPFPPGTQYLRDPERPGFRTGPGAAPLAYAGGFGVPYTYPDHNNFYLAEIDPTTGQVIVPSFHRPYLFGPLNLPATPPAGAVPPVANQYPFPGTAAPNWNPNWTNAEGKYLTLRPRPADNAAVNGGSFPFPLDAGGDVKNLDFAPGGADSIWIDIGAPVMTAADGRKYKMLVAPLILALDGRIDLNVVGNIMGAGDHRSNQGWGTWEVNPKKVLDANATEWTNLFNGSTATGNARIRGRYDGSPRGPIGAAIAGSNKVRQWMQLDYNGMNDTTGGTSSPMALQTAPSASSYFGYPTFNANSFGNGINENTNNQYGGAGGAPPGNNHASIYNALRPRSPNLRFPVESAAQMLRLGGTGSDMLVSDPMRLLSANLVGTGPSDANALRRRNLATPLSADLDRPGATPYLFDTTAGSTTRYVLNPVPPVAPATVVTAYTPSGFGTPPNNPAFPALGTALPASSEFDASFRSALAARLKLDLYRQLTAYPTPDATGLVDTTVAANATQVAQATTDRQKFAGDIFNVLLAVTGALSPQTAYDTYTKTSPEYRACRYCAQLAVNIVDYMDSDDISTPFNWANFTSANMTKDVVNEWVFGVETPRLVINEAYISYDNDPASLMGVAPLQKVDPTKNYNVNVWVELHNPMPAPAAADDTTAHLSTGAAGANLAYRILLADQTPNATLPQAMRDPGNSLGDPDFGQPAGTAYGQAASSVRSVLDSWGDPTPGKDPQSVTPGGGKFDWSANPSKSDGFYVIGPKSTFVDDTKDNPNLPTTATSAKMSYPVAANGANAGTKPRPTVLLQRLANPSLPFNNTPGANYNPYITTDFIRNSAAFVMDGRRFDTNGPIAAGPASGVMPNRYSVGRNQPLTAATGQRVAQAPTFTAPAVAPTNQPMHTFSRQNCTYDTQAALNASTATPPGGPPALPTPQTLRLPFDWLTHLDRLPINPLELLHVGDSRPHDLTQRFYTGGNPQGHLAPWTTPNARLYRFFEFVTTPTPATPAVAGGNLPTAGGRVVGKVNINAIRRDSPAGAPNAFSTVFRALADAQSGNSFIAAGPTTDDNVDQVWRAFETRRGIITTGSPPAPTDQLIANLTTGLPNAPTHNPIWSLALGQATASAGPPSSDPFLTTSTGTRGIENTLFQTAPGNPAPLFNVAGSHPYLQKELLRKIYGSVTTRSNVFAVWATVGFFECDSASPPNIGAEIGAAENRQIRHRMFSIVDRTQLQAWPTFNRDPVTLAPTAPPSPTVSVTTAITASPTLQFLQISATSVTHPNSATGVAWTAQDGAILVYEPNTDNEETVVVKAVTLPGPPPTPALQAVFQRNHAAGVAVVVRGNPGPLQRYDPRLDKEVVPYFGLID